MFDLVVFVTLFTRPLFRRICIRLGALLVFHVIAVSPTDAAVSRLDTVGQWPGWQRGLFSNIKVQGDFAYVTGNGGTGSSGLTIFNVADPANPQPVGWLNHSGDLAVSGRYAYLAEAWRGFQVVDVSNPSKPVRVGGWNGEFVFWRQIGEYVSHVAVSGHYAYVIDPWMSESSIGPVVGGLIILDISNPAAPVFVGASTFPDYQQNSIQNLKVSGGFAFVGSYGGTLVMDVTNPAQPVFNARYGNTSTEVPPGYSLSPGHVFLAQGGKMVVADVTDPANLFIVGTYDTGGETMSVAVNGTTACVANGTGGVRLFNVANPSDPLPLASFQTEGSAVDVAVAAGRAYVISSDNLSGPYWEHFSATARVEVIDLSSPSIPTRLGIHREIPGYSHGVAVGGDFAYVADDKAGLQVINVADRGNPMRVGTYDTPGDALGVAVVGDVAYVADNESGLQILYIKDPSSPIRLSSFNSPGQAYGVTVTNGHAYLADGSAGLQIIRVSTPASPARVGGYDTAGTAYGVAVSGSIAYVADGIAGVQIIDASAAVNPQRIGGYDTPGEVMGVALMGNHLLVADRLDGVFVLDVTARQNPVLVGAYTNSFQQGFNIGAPHSIAVRGQSAYVVGGGVQRLYQLDVSDPSKPKLQGVFPLKGAALGVAVSVESLFLASGRSGLEILADVGLRIHASDVPSGSGEFRFKWNALPDRTYRPQFTTNLVLGDWLDLPFAPIIQGTEAEVTDNTIDASPRFYRVIEEPLPEEQP